jgi:hypothetical protein
LILILVEPFRLLIIYLQEERVAVRGGDEASLPISVEAPTEEVIKITAKILGKDVRDVVVMVLDRPRNAVYVDAVRRLGAKLRMISDGDIAAAVGKGGRVGGIERVALECVFVFAWVSGVNIDGIFLARQRRQQRPFGGRFGLG